MEIGLEGTQTFLVEHYWPGVSADAFRAAADRVRVAAEEISLASAPVHFLHSTLVPEDENAFCVFSAASSALVEEAYRRADVAFERIVDALEFGHIAGVEATRVRRPT